jgi:hypothetical protein
VRDDRRLERDDRPARGERGANVGVKVEQRVAHPWRSSPASARSCGSSGIRIHSST